MQPAHSLDVVLRGAHVRLEPLEDRHLEGLVAAAAVDPSLYTWTSVPQGVVAARRYLELALAERAAGSAVPFATIRVADDAVIGSTRLWDLERWSWPRGHPRHGRSDPDVAEIGHTWLTSSAIRTAANTEAKQLMLGHAFDVWGVLRVCFHTDARNERSRAAIARIGGRFEGVLRAHRLAADNSPRDSARYSILASEWPDVRRRIERLVAGAGGERDETG